MYFRECIFWLDELLYIQVAKRERYGKKDAENLAKEKVKWLFQGNWRIISLEFEALMPLLEKSTVPFEDLYQYQCAKNEKLQLVTHNKKDFEQTTGVAISTPKEFLEQLKNQKILSEKDFAYP